MLTDDGFSRRRSVARVARELAGGADLHGALRREASVGDTARTQGNWKTSVNGTTMLNVTCLGRSVMLYPLFMRS